MNVTIKPIKAKRISDQVYEQLRDLIFRGTIKPGEQLMPERELSEALNVSRTTVRNAINKLVVLGLLEHKQGQGTFVRSPEARIGNIVAAAVENQDATIHELLEVRMGLECNAAFLAAERADEEDIQFMKGSIDSMRREGREGRLGTEEDAAFHMAIAYATKNPVHIYIMKNFYDFLFVGIKKNLTHLYEDPDNVHWILEQHTLVLENIIRRDPQGALNAMHRHIQYVQDFFKNRSS